MLLIAHPTGVTSRLLVGALYPATRSWSSPNLTLQKAGCEARAVAYTCSLGKLATLTWGVSKMGCRFSPFRIRPSARTRARSAVNHDGPQPWWWCAPENYCKTRPPSPRGTMASVSHGVIDVRLVAVGATRSATQNGVGRKISFVISCS